MTLEIKDFNRRLVRPGAWAAVGKGKVSIDFDALAAEIERIDNRMDRLSVAISTANINYVKLWQEFAKLRDRKPWYKRIFKRD